jgi:hypothetical protein
MGVFRTARYAMSDKKYYVKSSETPVAAGFLARSKGLV